MLQEDQARAAANTYDENNMYYSESDLPDEESQIEQIRRIRHNEVATEAQTTLQMLEDLKRQREMLHSSPSP